MTLKERINNEMKDAMRAGQKDRLAVIRLINAAIKQREVDELGAAGREKGLDEPQVIATLEKMIKQRRESIVQYEAGNRADLAAKEQAEIDIIKAYLPEALSEAEVDALIASAIAETGAASIKDMGKVVGIIKAKAAGRADMGAVSAKIKQKLGA
jgi:uncharacterized protein YqeY